MTDTSKLRSYAEIDLSAARANAAAVRGIVGEDLKIMAVVKADAYGHGAVEIARAVSGSVDRLAVADTAEARELREAGITIPIHTLGGLLPEEAADAAELDVCPAVGSVEEAARLAAPARARGRTIKLHLHVDTGMGRYGCRPEEAVDIARAIAALDGARIEGVSTHFADAEGDFAFTLKQLGRFEEVLAGLDGAGLKPELVHAANSPGITLHPDSHFNMVRPGLAIYGLSYCDEMSQRIDLAPVMTWKSRVVFAKTVKAGEPVGYGMTWQAPSDRVVATVSVGYADGYQRTLSNNTEVLLGGRKCPIAGRVAMDYINIDPSGAEFEIGDEVVLMGRQGDEVIRGEELAKRAGTIPHVIVTCICKRTRRIFVNG